MMLVDHASAPAWDELDTLWRTVHEPAPPRRAEFSGAERSGYRASTIARWPAAAGTALAVAGMLAGLVFMTIETQVRKPQKLVVYTLPTTPPPPPPAQPIEKRIVVPTAPQIVVPPPIIKAPHEVPAVATTLSPPPPLPVPVAASVATTPVVSAPATVADGGDLASKMIFAKPPAYPLESRRRKEEGTVTLALLITVEGLVADIAIAQTSGSGLLDKAALEAVRKWRWAPLVHGGQPVMVQGVVKIPFVLKR